MKTKLWKVVAVLAIAGVLALSLVRGAAARDQEDWERSERKLDGTWVVTVTLHNCSTGAQMGTPFESLLTFARGGTMTETTSNSMFFPALRGPGHGVWSRTDRHTYKASSLAFITMNGALVKKQKITQTIEMEDSDQFTTTDASVQFFDPAGNLLVTGCASATGQRFE